PLRSRSLRSSAGSRRCRAEGPAEVLIDGASQVTGGLIWAHAAPPTRRGADASVRMNKLLRPVIRSRIWHRKLQKNVQVGRSAGRSPTGTLGNRLRVAR